MGTGIRGWVRQQQKRQWQQWRQNDGELTMVGDDDDTFRHASSLVHCLWLNWLMHASMMLVDDAKLCYRSSLGCEPIHAAPLLSPWSFTSLRLRNDETTSSRQTSS